MNTPDPFRLRRFVDAQTQVYASVEVELRAGQKRTHWMWFIFPQMRGLGSSVMAQTFGIASLDEGRAYLAHPVLGPRLIACTRLVLAAQGSLQDIFGSPDDVKFYSSMTLFALADHEARGIFTQALQRFCNGTSDERTIALLQLSS